jgi:carbonic anhydrase
VPNIIDDCFLANRTWADRMRERDPLFFERLRHTQTPELLWIGCSDSRLPPNDIIGRAPGELFVHRNVGNVVVHTDVNCLSVLQYAIDVLGVKHVIVCGHYGCGGVRAAYEGRSLGLIDNWLHHIGDVYLRHRNEIDKQATEEARHNRLCEHNVRTQVANVAQTTILRDAWRRGQQVSVHGWVYSLQDGLLRDLGLRVEAFDQIPDVHRTHGSRRRSTNGV